MTEVSLAIIAGGQSRRMGRDKAFVELAGKAMIEHVIERSAGLGQSETLLITNRPDDYRHLGAGNVRGYSSRQRITGGDLHCADEGQTKPMCWCWLATCPSSRRICYVSWSCRWTRRQILSCRASMVIHKDCTRFTRKPACLLLPSS